MKFPIIHPALLLLGLTLVAIVAHIHGQVVYVNLQADCGTTCDGSQTRPFTSISEGLARFPSTSNQILDIAPGRYSGPRNTNLTLQSNYIVVRGAGHDKTIIDCNGDSQAFGLRLISGTYELNDLSIQNCKTSETEYGSALYLTSTSVVMRNITLISNSHNMANGGAIYTVSSTLEIQNSLLEGNRAGMGVGGAIYTFRGTTLLHDCVLRNNVDRDGANDIACDEATVELRGNTQAFSGAKCHKCTLKTNGVTSNNCSPYSSATSNFVLNKLMLLVWTGAVALLLIMV